ncbi:hypothetical protein EXIGLDRAFT_817593 [Exidia glandulosa HHB12029]|uniref:Uncharacterized protein n=1 Tax=Exidia glandulosa HHB12029 TaxID=1314781 RepID=A0A165B897_EXIGL|nr:hypothetical protein EXIGLDRAFT_817593 [Exidia glandulosa HHB12029]
MPPCALRGYTEPAPTSCRGRAAARSSRRRGRGRVLSRRTGGPAAPTARQGPASCGGAQSNGAMVVGRERDVSSRRTELRAVPPGISARDSPQQRSGTAE